MTVTPALDPKPARLLLVDDDRLILATLGQGLRARGYDITTADSAESALARANQQSFDLAILDISMPGMSGIEAASQLREQHGLHCLFLTAYSDEPTVSQAVSEGALGYLVKPVDLNQVVPAVLAALARVRDIRALRASQEQLEQALASGRTTSVAIGLMMERRQLDHDAAFQLLRSEARAQSRKLEELAQELVEAADTLNRLGNPRR